MNQWNVEPINQWTNEPMNGGLRYQWNDMNEWTNETLNQRIHESPVDQL